MNKKNTKEEDKSEGQGRIKEEIDKGVRNEEAV